MKVGIHEAKTKLSKLIPAVLAGEDVIITKSGQALVKLVPVDEQEGIRLLGCYTGEIEFKGDLLAHQPEQIVEAFWSDKK